MASVVAAALLPMFGTGQSNPAAHGAGAAAAVGAPATAINPAVSAAPATALLTMIRLGNVVERTARCFAELTETPGRSVGGVDAVTEVSFLV